MLWSLIHFFLLLFVVVSVRSEVHCLVCGDPFVPVPLAEDSILWTLHLLNGLFASL